MNSPDTIHERSTAAPTIQKMPPAYSPVLDFANPIGMNAATVISAPVKSRHGGCRIREGRCFGALPTALELHHHHLEGNDRVVDQQTERDDQRPERDPLEIPARHEHHDGHRAEHQRHGHRDDDAGAPAETQETHDDAR